MATAKAASKVPAKPTASQPARKMPPVNMISHAEKDKGYRYIDKDEDMDYICGLIVASGHTPDWFERESEKIGRKISSSCIMGWLYRGTKRPQNYTMTTVMILLGFEKQWVGRGKAIQPTKEEVAALHKPPGEEFKEDAKPPQLAGPAKAIAAPADTARPTLPPVDDKALSPVKGLTSGKVRSRRKQPAQA